MGAAEGLSDAVAVGAGVTTAVGEDVGAKVGDDVVIGMHPTCFPPHSHPGALLH